jgi:hypothetical protein
MYWEQQSRSRLDFYPWSVVRVEDRADYLKALDRASIDLDARPFASFIAERVRWSLKKMKRSVRASIHDSRFFDGSR